MVCHIIITLPTVLCCCWLRIRRHPTCNWSNQ